MIVNQKKYVLSEWDETAQCYINTWFGNVGKDEFKDAVMIGRNFMIENKVKVHLADATQMRTGWNGAEEWLFSNFWKQVHEAGLKYFGIVLPESIFLEFASMQMEQKMQEIGVNVTYRAFDSMEKAKEWSQKVQGLKK